MAITSEVVQHTAKLARLRLDGSEEKAFTRELGRILEYMDKLNELNTGGVTPTSHVVNLHNVWRKDVRKSSLPRERAMENAPDQGDGYFRVPRVIE